MLCAYATLHIDFFQICTFTLLLLVAHQLTMQSDAKNLVGDDDLHQLTEIIMQRHIRSSSSNIHGQHCYRAQQHKFHHLDDDCVCFCRVDVCSWQCED